MRPTKPAAALVGLIIAVFSVLISLTTSAQAAPTATSCVGGYPPSQCTVALSASTVTPGGTLSFSASGYTPGETAQGTVFSTPIVVGKWTANSSGVVSGSFTVPTSLSPGTHTFQLAGLTSGVIKSAQFTVVAGSSSSSTSGKSSLPFTGANVMPLVGAGAALVLGGGAAVAVARRRKNTQSAA